MKLNKILFIAFILITHTLVLNQVNAQDVSVAHSNTKVYIDGKPFWVHRIEYGHTIYSICKTYKVDEKTLKQNNPSLSKGIFVGETIRIPVSDSELAGGGKKADYVNHTVVKKQTLFYISRLYGVDINDIVRLNPALSQGLIENMVLKIPTGGKIARGVLYHKVEKGQTLYFLSEFYGIEIADIYEYNPTIIKSGFKAGDTIIIPMPKRITIDILDIENTEYFSGGKYTDPASFYLNTIQERCDSFYYTPKDTFHVVLMLPLFLTENADMGGKTTAEGLAFHGNTRRFFEFYEGVILALERLQNENISVKLHVFDTRRDVARIKKILWKPELAKADLIIGPIYSDELPVVSEYAEKRGIPIVSPLAKTPDILASNPYFFQITPSDETRVGRTAQYLSNFYNTSIIAVHNGLDAEKKIIQTYKDRIRHSYQYGNLNDRIIFKEVNYRLSGPEGLDDALSVGLKNIVIVPIEKEAQVMDIISKLDYFAKSYDIVVFGMPEWEAFENVEMDIITNLQLHIPASSYIDFENWRVKSVFRRFKDVYKTEPSAFSLLGYDITTFFLHAMKEHGNNFVKCIHDSQLISYKKGIQTDFDFARVTPMGGFENTNIFILNYTKNYTLKNLASSLRGGYYIYGSADKGK